MDMKEKLYMDWKNQRENEYPNIILSDCFVDTIQVDEKDIIVSFPKHGKSGFIIREEGNSGSYRTNSAQIIMKDCDIEDISIQFVYRKRAMAGKSKQMIKDIEPCAFVRGISSGKWRLEIVEEYYSALGGLFIGRIHDAGRSGWCYIKVRFKNMIYYWDEVNPDCPVG